MGKKRGLSQFEGMEVVRATIALTNAGDGLSQAMKIDPTEHHQGDKLFIVIEAECTRVAFEPFAKNDPTGPQQRVHTLRAGTATLVDRKLVADVLEEQEKANAKLAEEELRAKEAEAGIQRLPIGEASELTIRMRTWLSSLKKSELQELCDGHGVEYLARATAADLIELLAENADLIREAMEVATGGE